MIKCENGRTICCGSGKEILADLACVAKAVACTMTERNISECNANATIMSLIYTALNGSVKTARDNKETE